MKQLLFNALIVNEGRKFTGYVAIDESGIIRSVGEGNPSQSLINEYADSTLDLAGNVLIPGVIDSHVHFREPGVEHKATIYTESRAAVAGGVTSYMEMPNTSPATTTLEALEDKFARATADSMANYSFYIGATHDNLNVLKAADYTRIPGIKLFMGSSTGGMLVNSEDALSEIFKLPVLIAAHCEDEETISANTQAVKELYGDTDPGIRWHPEIRSVLACCKSTAKAIQLAKKYNTRLHILHLSTEQETRMLAQAPENITGEVCVAHLIFDDRDYVRLGTKIKCNPAVKSVQHKWELAAALNEGIISTISTDHAPHTLSEKNQPLFKAPSGIPMIQFSLPNMIESADYLHLSLETIVEKMCHNQADIFGIENRGYIREGYWADLVQLNLLENTHVDEDTILSKCKWSPLDAYNIRSRVKRTWVNGSIVYDDTIGIIEENKNAAPLRFSCEKRNCRKLNDV
ncbi:MAG: dihydroorotase [Prevotella sp.]|nr:dihydroorotase [Prevotella sp.]MCM1074706.1 dihydroorotase [Ruminococcus sp.]